MENQFDIRDPATGRTIDPSEVERDARLAVEEELLAERRALLVERQALYEDERRGLRPLPVSGRCCPKSRACAAVNPKPDAQGVRRGQLQP